MSMRRNAGFAALVFALGGRIHAISGRIINTDGAVPTHEVYDPATNKWTPAAPLPTARDHVGIAVDGKIHIYGGRKSNAVKGRVGLHHVCDPGSDKWGEAAPMPVFGQQRHLRAVSRAYDPKTDRWRLLAPIPVERHAQAAAVAGNKPYMISQRLDRLRRRRFARGQSCPHFALSYPFGRLGLLQGLAVKFAHLKHCFHDPLCFPGILITDHLAQIAGNDLPRQTKFVFKPAALSTFPAGGQLFPHLVDLLLRLAALMPTS